MHADSCTGQNKNNCMIQYLVWRTLTNRHTNITLSFLPVGHTKFSPDWCFGLFKRMYRKTKVGSLSSISECVNKSAQCNFAQLVSREDGSTIVQTCDWTDYFAPRMKKITGIKKYHHFRLSSASPGTIFVKERSDSVEVEVDLLKDPWNPDVDELPPVVPPRGLNADRQWYLYEQIRPFCPLEDQDSVCPLPSVPNRVEVEEVLRILTAQCPHQLNVDVCVPFVRKRVMTGEHAQTNRLLLLCGLIPRPSHIFYFILYIYASFCTSLNKCCASIP